MRDTHQGHGTLSVRSMVLAVAALNVTLSKSQVDRDYKEGAPRHSARAFLAWRAAFRELGRTAESRIDRPQTPATHTPPPSEGTDAAARKPAAVEPAGSPAESSSKGDDSAGPGDDELGAPGDEHTAAFRQDRSRNERIKADRAELELQQLRGELVSVRDSEELHFTSSRITRDRVLMVAPRFAGELHALVLSLVPEELRAEVAKRLDVHTFERRLETVLRDSLEEAAQAIADNGRDDDDPD